MVESGYLNTVSVDLDSVVWRQEETGSVVDGGHRFVLESARIIGATLVPFPAMREARIHSVFDIGIDIEAETLFDSAFAKLASGEMESKSMGSVALLDRVRNQKSIYISDALEILSSASNDPNSVFATIDFQEFRDGLKETIKPKESTGRFLLGINSSINDKKV